MLRSILALSTSSAPVLAGLVAASAIGARSAAVKFQKRLATHDRRRASKSASSLEVVRGGTSTAKWRRKHGIGAPYSARAGARPVGSREIVHLDDLEQEMAARVIPFVEGMADLPLAEWLMIGRSVVADEQGVGSRSRFHAILEATIADRGLNVAAWYVRDGIKTAAFYATHGASRLSQSECRDFAVARVAAEGAALALLAFPHLADMDFGVLHAPFARTDFSSAKSAARV